MLFPMLNDLYFYISTFRSKCAVTSVAVLCSSLIPCFPSMLLRNFLNDFAMVPAASVITIITFDFTFHMSCISVARSSHRRTFSACFLNTFLSREIVVSNGIHVPVSSTRVVTSAVLLGMFGWFALVGSVIYLL